MSFLFQFMRKCNMLRLFYEFLGLAFRHLLQSAIPYTHTGALAGRCLELRSISRYAEDSLCGGRWLYRFGITLSDWRLGASGTGRGLVSLRYVGGQCVRLFDYWILGRINQLPAAVQFRGAIICLSGRSRRVYDLFNFRL